MVGLQNGYNLATYWLRVKLGNMYWLQNGYKKTLLSYKSATEIMVLATKLLREKIDWLQIGYE